MRWTLESLQTPLKAWSLLLEMGLEPKRLSGLMMGVPEQRAGLGWATPGILHWRKVCGGSWYSWLSGDSS